MTLHDGVSPWPFADRSFDVCLLLFVLHHVEDEACVRRMLSDAARVTRDLVLVMEDQPRLASSPDLCNLAFAVTAEHFRPFKQDPAVFIKNIRPDPAWRSLFLASGLSVTCTKEIPGTLQHPVPHILYVLRPMRENVGSGLTSIPSRHDELELKTLK